MDYSSHNVAGQRYAGEAALPPNSYVTTPPDNRCMYYCILAAQDVVGWQAIARDGHGFIADRRQEREMRAEAIALRARLTGEM